MRRSNATCSSRRRRPSHSRGRPDDGAARFLPAADEARPVAAAPAARRTTRAVRGPRAAAALARAVEAPAPAPAPTPALEVAAAEPQPERMVRHAGEEGTTSMTVGVVLRGGAVGDDKCERELPRARPAAVAFRTGPVVRLGLGTTTTPRVHGPTPYLPPF
jgi:hypothetical protein